MIMRQGWPVRVLVRVGALAAALAAYFGIAQLLPAGKADVAGFIALATVAIGSFVWAMRDGREVVLGDGLRDWLIVAFIIAVLWWVTLSLFEGGESIVDQIRTRFWSVLTTVGMTFAPATLGLLLGQGSRNP